MPSPDQSELAAESFERPVVAEVVADKLVDPLDRGPFRFGLKTLLLLTAVCCGQFTLMSYVGILIGLASTAVACLAILAALIFIPVLFRLRPESAAMGTLDGIALWLTMGVLVLFVGSVLAGGGQLVYQEIEEFRMVFRLKRDLGFTCSTEYVDNGYGPGDFTTEKAIRVESVSAGSLFADAGVQKDDVIVSELGLDAFLQMLEENRGQAVSITVDRGGKGVGIYALDEANQIQVEVVLPR